MVIAYEQRTKEDWDRIMKGAEAKQHRINRAVALQAAVAFIAGMKPNKAIEAVVPDVIDIARAFEKYLGEK